MLPRIRLMAIVAYAAGLWALLLLIAGTGVPQGFFAPFSKVLAGIVLILVVFDRWAWRWPLVNAFIAGTPVLAGTWAGTLVSGWSDPDTGAKADPKDVFLAVRQTHSSLELRLLSNESESESLSASIVPMSSDMWCVVSVYRNTPRIGLRESSPIHHGALLLTVYGSPPTGLRGTYWTDRDTNGEMRFERCTAALACTYDEAVACSDASTQSRP